MNFGRSSKAAMLCAAGLVLLQSCSSEPGSEPEPAQTADLQSDFAVTGPPPIIPGPPADPTQKKLGYFVDSAVSGLHYLRSDGIAGVTGADGEFEYFPGDSIEFRVGQVSLGSVTTPASELLFPPEFQVTPLLLSPGAEFADHPAALNRLIFLQTLDFDGDLGNGIQITAAVHAAAAGKTIDFETSTDSFVSGDFAALLAQLNAEQAFSTGSPRSMQSKIDALRHFGELNVYGFPWPTDTYSAWWSETNACTGYGKSTLTLHAASVEFCPNVRGFDGCYEGVVLGNGDVLLPEMASNAVCAEYAQMIPGFILPGCEGYQQQTLVANLKIVDRVISGQYQASCESSVTDQVQTIAADFDKTRSEGGLLSSGNSLLYGLRNSLFAELELLTRDGSCSDNSDCATLRLQGRYNCALPTDLPYSTIDADTDLLNFSEWVYEDIDEEIARNESGGGSTICYIPRAPIARCLANRCGFAG